MKISIPAGGALWAPLFTMACLLAACAERSPAPQPAEQVFFNGVVYTADTEQSTASALAISGQRIVYVGDDAGARALVAESTEVIDLEGRMLLPGLHDMHIHPMGIVDDGSCDIDSEPLDLAAIAALVKQCIAERELPEGEWLSVMQWNFAVGNQPAGDFANVRQALDAAAPDHPVMLWGNDGHHGAVNSVALARAVNDAGVIVGINAETLAEDFADYREVIGVDAAGNPNGELHETARYLVQPPPRRLLGGLPPELMGQVAAKLAANGITTAMDAATPPESLPAYKALLDSGEMSFNLSTALFLDVPSFEREGGIDVAAMIETIQTLKAEYDPLSLITVDTAKIFVDGVLEANPLNDPPTLPNAAVVNPYKQPRFAIDLENETAEIVGYVDTDSEMCQKVRDAMDHYLTPQVNQTFRREFGFYPQQCRVSRGVLEHPADFIQAYMRELDAAGIKIHAHVIGDRAVRTAVDGLEALRKSNGDSGLLHSLAHIQLVAPSEYPRIGDLGLYLVFTYAWLAPEFFYDLTVNPFIDALDSVDDIYGADSYYMTNTYPAAQLAAQGAVLAAGSDAPVDTREPRPFYNIQQAVTRANEHGTVLNPAGRIGIRDALDAYTINGARLFGHDGDTGSLEVGKYADLVMIDRDLLALADEGGANRIAEAEVLMTVFRGEVVYR
ncbi:MAG: amidohydrolase [Halieaceae bacterium]|jgi:predicted amidohydrolase YtcJ|nr:amidohydrolase [Halieaceae bacterium]